MALEEESYFMWGERSLEDSTNNKSKRRSRSEKCITKYSTCYINNKLISIGDDVIIDIENEMDAVGLIQELYNDTSQEEPCRAVIHWYFKKHELPTKVQEKIGTFLSEDYELFWPEDKSGNLRGCVEDIDAETIREKCWVVLLPSCKSNHETFGGKFCIRYGFTFDNKLISDSELSVYISNFVKKNNMLLRSASKRKASKSIPDETEVKSKFKRCLADSRKYGQFATTEVIQIISDDNVFQDDNKSEASSHVSSINEEQNSDGGTKVLKSNKRTSRGNRKQSEERLNRRSTRNKGDKANENKSRECIEIEDDDFEEKNNVRRSTRKTPKSKPRVTRETPKNEVKTPGKIPQREKKTSKKETQSTQKKSISIATEKKNKKNKKKNNKSDSDSGENYNPAVEEESETEDEDESGGSEDEVSEEEEYNRSDSGRNSTRKSKKTPIRSVKSSTTKRKQQANTPKRRNMSSPKTPKSRRKSRLSFATPCIPVRAKSCKTPVTPLEKTRASLHVSAVPSSLPCREQQFEDICSFVEGKLSDDTGGCMYISGVPGTGKTATVHEVMRSLEEMRSNEQVEDFKFYEINGMKVTQPNQVYVMFYKFLTAEKVTADHASSLLDKYFNNSAKRKEHIILLVDELDQLWTRKQDVMYHLFDWPTRRRSKLIVIAIANTMDLPERMMINRVSSRLGLTRMTFQPYTYSQLQEIVTSRIRELDAFEQEAAQLVARKVAALSGDARRCLDICRRAVEIAEQEAISSKTKQQLVGMPHVEKALNEMFSSPKILAMKNLSMMEGYLLKSVLAEFRRTGLEEASFSGVYSQLVELCRLEGVSTPLSSLASAICSRLGATRLLLVDSGKCDIKQRIRLNVNKDDILFALKAAKKETSK
ncbi:origin recognition complex subunit 1-like [Dendronephthya gigantea]|uniref:origin recognition complex subunit 1-like n=1 Tax=Dendronephthya gigantea TaxID=151771 RepID=UPI00106BFAA7|nr:origin recognition complex subunit 1-like [Dendronephthya gigantea]